MAKIRVPADCYEIATQVPTVLLPGHAMAWFNEHGWVFAGYDATTGQEMYLPAGHPRITEARDTRSMICVGSYGEVEVGLIKEEKMSNNNTNTNEDYLVVPDAIRDLDDGALARLASEYTSGDQTFHSNADGTFGVAAWTSDDSYWHVDSVERGALELRLAQAARTLASLLE